MAEIEKEAIRSTLQYVGNNRAKAAKILGVQNEQSSGNQGIQSVRRIINSTSVLICVQFTLGTAHLFAASNDLNSNNGNPGIFGAILGVVVPTLLIIAIGGGVYVWLRRNKPSLTGLFPRRRTPKIGIYRRRHIQRLRHPRCPSWYRTFRQTRPVD